MNVSFVTDLPNKEDMNSVFLKINKTSGIKKEK